MLREDVELQAVLRRMQLVLLCLLWLRDKADSSKITLRSNYIGILVIPQLCKSI